MAVGALPRGGGLPLGAASAVPVIAAQAARASARVLKLLFMAWFLSSLRARPFSRLHQVRESRRQFLTPLQKNY